MEIKQALSFDDVLLMPGECDFQLNDADVSTTFARGIDLNIPLVSSAMDTVTEHEMAIAMAQAGGIGVIHRNMSVDEQASQVKKVKRFESAVVYDPVMLRPGDTIGSARTLQRKHNISGFPVVDDKGYLCGIITSRDMRFLENDNMLVQEAMTKENLVIARAPVDLADVKKMIQARRVEKVIITDDNNKCIGLLTVKDIERAVLNPHACKDEKGQLRVAAATSVGDKGFERSLALIDNGVDVLTIDSAHGHSKAVMDAVKRLKKHAGYVRVVAGNVATADGARAMLDCGADGIKVGIGPGSICTTRIVTGVGVPQITAITECFRVMKDSGVPLIADGGIRFSGDIVKAIMAGASCVMVGSMVAGTDESPGQVYMYGGRSYKAYRGMGSIGAMERGSADRYFRPEGISHSKMIPEGVEGQVPYKGSVSAVIHQLIGAVRAGMGYVGKHNINDMRGNGNFVRITTAGMKESHVHDVQIVKEAPNYYCERG